MVYCVNRMPPIAPAVTVQHVQNTADRANWRRVARRKVIKVYTDHGISSSKGRDQRPAFDSLIKDATRGKFDIIAAWSVDRLGRSLKDLLGFLSEIHALEVDLYLHQQAVDTTTPAGRALFQMMGVLAEFDRAMIRERVMAGLRRAKANHVQLGRPKVAAKVEEQVKSEW
jgi:DNA invertase Pin-like site-specific DNA recombinase